MEVLGFGIHGITAFILVLARTAGIFTTAPIFGNANVPKMVRIPFAVALAFVYLPMARYSEVSLELMPFLIVVLKEVLLGIVLGFIVEMMFAAIQSAGSLIDIQIGFGLANVFDPVSKQQSGVIARFYFLVSVLVFLLANGHHLLIMGLADSYRAIPLGTLSITTQAAWGTLDIFMQFFMAGLKLGAPIVGAIFLTDVALGILSRTVPQLNVFIVGFPAKLAVGLFTIAASMPIAIAIMIRMFQALRADFSVILKHLTG
ncbi:MAG: flagellar biosynthetic protein FliR [Armatimonadota bacterium]